MSLEIVLNEFEFAQRALCYGITEGNASDTLYILSKYFWHHEKLASKSVYDKLNDYMGRFYLGYDENRWAKTLENITRFSKKRNLIVLSGIPITERELKKIADIKKKPIQRVLFTLLVIAKYYNTVSSKNNNWVNKSFCDIFSYARVKITKTEQALMLGYLKSEGVISFSKVVDNTNVRVNIIDNDSPPALYVSDGREFGLQYARYIGEKICECKECKRLFRPSGRNSQYCDEHRNRRIPGVKIITCSDCGKKFAVPSQSNTKSKCETCYQEYIRQKNREKVVRYRLRKSM